MKQTGREEMKQAPGVEMDKGRGAEKARLRAAMRVQKHRTKQHSEAEERINLETLRKKERTKQHLVMNREAQISRIAKRKRSFSKVPRSFVELLLIWAVINPLCTLHFLRLPGSARPFLFLQ